jgi:hypothetical protein
MRYCVIVWLPWGDADIKLFDDLKQAKKYGKDAYKRYEVVEGVDILDEKENIIATF